MYLLQMCEISSYLSRDSLQENNSMTEFPGLEIPAPEQIYNPYSLHIMGRRISYEKKKIHMVTLLHLYVIN